MQELIKLTNVTKKWGKTVLLENINLSIHKGESIALIGNNGVGKSTLLKIISKLSAISSGKIEYNSDLLFHYVPEKFPSSNLTVVQYLELMGKIDGIATDGIRKRVENLLMDFFMEHMSNTPLKYLSKGSLQKVGVIQALLVTPDVLLLDEPISGQDVNSQRVFMQKMRDLLADGMTIIMSCHEKYLINEISDTVVKIKNRQIEVTEHKKVKISDNYVLTFADITARSQIPVFDFPIDKDTGMVKLFVPQSETDEVIKSMINSGWSLREMSNEEVN